MVPKPDPVLATARPGDLVGLYAKCPRFRCDYRTTASAEIVNEYGVRDVLPRRCPRHGTLLVVERIVEVVRDA